jgi:hypothetical protein
MANKKINQLVSKTAILSTDIFGIGDATTGQLFKKTIAELQAAIGGAVISVNGLVGTVVLDTDDIQELATPTNKYFTDARARGAISLTVTGNSGASTYSSGTGVLNVPTYTLAGLGGISATFLSGTSGISYNSTTGVISYSGTVYTDASIRALLSGSTGISYNSTTGAISYSGTVYTDSSVRALISITTTGTSGASTYNNTTGVINVPNYTLAGLGGISLTSLSGGTGITYNNTTGAISYSGTVYTDASVRALISASGAVSYNNTTGVVSLTSGNLTEATSSVLTITGGTGAVLGSGTSIQVKQASSTVSGFLSSADWGTFNSKQGTITLTTTGTSGSATLSIGTLNIPQYIGGSGTTNYIPKFTSSNVIGDSAISDNGTTVSLISRALSGTSAIFSSTLNVQNFFSLSSTSSPVAPSSGKSIEMVYRTDSGNDFAFIQTYDRTNSIFKPLRIYASTLILNEGGVGNVGIGTISPSNLLHVNGSGTETATFETSGSASGIRLKNTGGTASEWILQSEGGNSSAAFKIYSLSASAYRFTILGDGKVGIGTTTPSTQFMVANSSTTINTCYFENGAAGHGLAVTTSGNDGTHYIANFRSTGVDRFRVLDNGNILINTSTDNGYRLYVSGTIYATGNITANSDLTLKKNLELITNPTDKLMQLNGYSYQWKEDDSHQYGVIAQEVEKILPYAVSTGNDGIKGVSYNQIIPVLIEAVKEQKAKIENLEILLASK